MTSKEIILAALRKKPEERYGCFEQFWKEVLREDCWGKKGYPVGISPEIYFDLDINLVGGWFETDSFIGVNEIIEQNSEWEITKSGSGQIMKRYKDKTGVPEHISFELTGPEIWNKKYREPLLSLDRRRLDFEGIRRYMALARQNKKCAVLCGSFIMEISRNKIGDENFLPATLLEPEWIKDFFRVYTDFCIRHWECLFKEVGKPDAMWVFDDMAYKNGPFMSPDSMRELILPYWKEYLDYFHSNGLPVFLHSCGDVRKCMPLIIEAGFDCLYPMEAKAGVDVIELAREYKDKIDLPFFIMTRADSIIDEDKIKLLKETGCVTIGIGVESGNENIRMKLLNKKIPNYNTVREMQEKL
ncbi:MAG: uroporphyrinogen decarboxylase family protein, partial [Candidatus Firestonebacteria bacterium]